MDLLTQSSVHRATSMLAQVLPMPMLPKLPKPVALLQLPTMILLGVVLVLLGIAWFGCQYLRRLPESRINPAVVQSFSSRVSGWWMMYAVMGLCLLTGSSRLLVVLFFFVISFWALREFITLTPTRLGDHRALFWIFFIFAPFQYFLVYIGQGPITLGKFIPFELDAHRLFTNFIPVYAFLFIPTRIALAGDHKRFLERTAKIQSGLLVCVYALSHAPALLDLNLTNEKIGKVGSAGILVFFILVVQAGDVFQFVWNHLLGKRVIAKAINANKTWEGLIGGVISAALVGMGLSWFTPFSLVQAAGMSVILALMGFAGSMTMSAVKRDRGVQDYGTLVEGHSGVLDRFDSICFAAPIFYHATRFFFT